MKEPLYVWADEPGIELKLTQPAPHQVRVEIVTRGATEKVWATATMASFRWQRIADYFTAAGEAPRQELEEK